MLNRIVLAGGSGYLGRVLAAYYSDKANEIVVLSRQQKGVEGNIRYQYWNGTDPGAWTSVLEGCDLLVNLAGKNVNCRYTAENKKAILASRVTPTTLLGRVIGQLEHPPKVWINLASATIYRHAEDRPQDEVNGDIGYGFSVDVCKAWEAAFWQSPTPGTKKILLRVGIVLGREDGVFPRLKKLVQFGLGGKQGTGRQMVSWIHEQDFARIVAWAHEHGAGGDVYNATAPEPVCNRDLMRHIRNAYGIRMGLDAPHWLLEMGALLIGTETELLLKSRWVVPKSLTDAGFSFLYPQAEWAINELMGSRT